MQAGALFAAGHIQAEVARTLGVARQNVSRWHARWQAGGLHYRLLRPARRAIERNERAIARWVAEDWP
jgi:transposase